ncbi:MAG: HPr family phosphocarrier protein [Planctomycetes bacterium]|jgi:phosphotransferase system HPr-like phosphotransfer protein|nr:HPr family phosphocarrier protein [Planctomycetota bacterium]
MPETLFAGSREKVISVEEFLPVVTEAAAGLLALRDEVSRGENREWNRRFISRMLRDVQHLRTVLMDYEAQENREFSYFTEIAAGIRGFATLIYVLKHLKERYLRSPIRERNPTEDVFLVETQRTLVFCGRTLRSLFEALVEECGILGVGVPEAEPTEQANGSAPPAIRCHLPHNIGEEAIGGEGEMIAQVAAHFLRVADDYAALRPKHLATLGELRDFVLGKLDEEEARRIESSMHAIQSKYDTYIQQTRTEQADADLKRLRSIISLTLHLFEITTHAIHFYERHENDIRSASAMEKLAKIVDKTGVLDRAVNYAFRTAGTFIAAGREIATRLIPAYTSIRDITIPIPPDVRLHIRPAALIAAVVAHHGTPVRMRMGGHEVDAESVTEVIYLAGSNQDAREVSFLGDHRPLDDLRLLFEVGLQDDGHEKILARLPYLRRT